MIFLPLAIWLVIGYCFLLSKQGRKLVDKIDLNVRGFSEFEQMLVTYGFLLIATGPFGLVWALLANWIDDRKKR